MKFPYNGRLTTAVLTIFWTATSAAPTITLPLSAFTSSVESDKVAIYYPNPSNSTPILLGNDGSPAGGFHTWSFSSDSSPSQMTELNFEYTGRTKLVDFVYNLGGKDVIVTLSQSDSLLRFFDSVSVSELPVMGGRKKIWGDFSSWCFWKSAEGHQYFYLFGKKIVSLFLIREGQNSGIEVLEVLLSRYAINRYVRVLIFGNPHRFNHSLSRLKQRLV
jgi:3-phytase